ncbi:hypothetical protein IB270_33225 [Ensifer sp. ENS05]|uniref:hypothetical protein n=1 Tax=Ensifer sp. ENS05 TaxID=2769277 RepID=UPI001785BA60|nr:hypothetical protein [Ensifer sp. ENS05]MBD9597688.1 hypothetical protein [Ensifer sp. ENS05]
MPADLVISSDDAVWADGVVISQDCSSLHAPYGSTIAAMGLPVEFHCHGLGRYDFSAFATSDVAQARWLEEINALAEKESIIVVVTLFVRSGELSILEDLVQVWHCERSRNRLKNIGGFGIEGPMLASIGGTPKSGGWIPTDAEWTRISDLGRMGVIYTVVSQSSGVENARFSSVIDCLCSNGIHPALGHFPQDDVAKALKSIEITLDRAELHGVKVLTDHLFNDMPRNFRHAWRTEKEKRGRLSELMSERDVRWTSSNLEKIVGPVAAALMKAALEKKLSLCVNFDGEHVDSSVLRKTVDFVGADQIVAMTDRVDVPRLKGFHLADKPGSKLWYVNGTTVAASKSTIDDQIRLMASQLRMTDCEILKATVVNPRRFLPKIVRDNLPEDWLTQLSMHPARTSIGG